MSIVLALSLVDAKILKSSKPAVSLDTSLKANTFAVSHPPSCPYLSSSPARLLRNRFSIFFRVCDLLGNLIWSAYEIELETDEGAFEQVVGLSGASGQQMFLGTPTKVYIVDKTENNPATVMGKSLCSASARNCFERGRNFALWTNSDSNCC